MFSRGGSAPVSVRLENWHDTRRARLIPVKCYLPALPPAGVILFSHGLGGSREGGADWLRHWASRGFAAVALQHPGSDEKLLKAGSPLALRRALQSAMTREQLLNRVGDVVFAVRQLDHGALPEVPPGMPLGISGHSFGAVTTLAVVGERLDGHQAATNAEIRGRFSAALALSPSARGEHALLPARFGSIHLPCFSITGTRDDGIGLSDITAANRLLPYKHMPGPEKYLLVMGGGGHLDFAGQSSAGEKMIFRRSPPPEGLRSAVAGASTAFWLARLAGEASAHQWLREVFPLALGADDHFEFK